MQFVERIAEYKEKQILVHDIKGEIATRGFLKDIGSDYIEIHLKSGKKLLILIANIVHLEEIEEENS